MWLIFLAHHPWSYQTSLEPVQRVTDCGAAKLQTRFSETIWVGWAGDNKHHLEIEVIGWECRKGFEMCAVGGEGLFLVFLEFGLFWFFGRWGVLLFSFFHWVFMPMYPLWVYWVRLPIVLPRGLCPSSFCLVLLPLAHKSVFCQWLSEQGERGTKQSIVLWEQCSWVLQAHFQVIAVKAELEKLLDWSQL